MLRWRAGLLAFATVLSAVVLMCLVASLEWVGRAFMGFLMSRGRIVAPIGLGHWTGFQADVPFGAELVETEGRPAEQVEVLVERVWELPVGTPLRYTFETSQGRVERTVPVMEFTVADYLSLFGVWLVNGGLFLVLGFLVAHLKPGRPASAAMLALCVAWGLTLLLSLGDFHRFLFRSTYAVAQAVAPAALIALAVTFPDRPFPRRAVPLLAVLAVATVVHAGLDISLYDRNPRLWMLFFEASTVYLALAALASCVLLRARYRRAPSDDRARMQVVGLGAAIGFGAPALVHLAAMLAGVDLPVNLLPIATTVFPVAAAYAILKQDVLALDPLLTRSTFYAVLTTAVTVGYIGLLALANSIRPALHAPASTWGPFAFALAAVGVAAPLRRAAQAAVDRLFFRSPYEPDAALERLSRTLTVSLDRDEVGASIARALADTVAPAPCWLLLPGADGRLHAPGGPSLGSDDPLLAGAPGPGAQVISVAAGRDAGAERLRAMGVVLAVPLRAEDRVEGVLALGPKQSGALYSTRDLALLRTLGNQAAIALRHAASYAAVCELTTTLEERVADGTRELVRTQGELARADKLASLGRLVAGVAHEINNPVAFVNASVDLIHDAALRMRDGLDGNADPAVLAALEQLLENAGICRDGATRAARIVRDLTAFSRTARSTPEPVDLRAAVERTLQLLRGEYRDRITIVRDYGDVPHPQGNAGEIDQVLMNIVANAVQAIDGAGELRIRTRAADGSVFVEVSDTGRGIAPEVQERVFEPFFTTRSGEGTGLGLAIAHSVVARHGGDLTLRSVVGRGTTFIVRLPVVPPATATEAS